ncbi:M14 family zinc carboxypeptidase [Aestuariibacter sp. A3R04]|uniref:M14 family zinc carboxypeptidase n=1 Tax=Aestuariibacter sp. A3R04 TaxID=2841571 RepID=UPI001C07FEEC|nr:M14 family zinc carboxypeptidase [Aestuariibacter sp. A3R04]MBU3023979.1 peptidase M14 [Aestuariibacter sp. A3R04]
MTAHPHLPSADIDEKFESLHWQELNKAHLTASDIAPVMERIRSHVSIISTQVGTSYEGRSIERFSLGDGPLALLAWTQMHGDEATATASVLDWLQILLTSAPVGLPTDWRSRVTLHIIPMLNPDGAERRTRVNGQGIDMNRDAKALQSPEGRILHQQVAELSPDIAFNLHDQNPYYTTGMSANPATIAFLAPAYHKDKHVDGPRLRAKQLIAAMNETLQYYIPDCIGRYDDTYSFRSFGDNIAGSGASTILIESGAAHNDPNRQVARKMNVIALQTALESLLTQQFEQYSLADYYRIPDNRENGLCDIKIEHIGMGDREAFQADVSVTVDRKTQCSQIGAIGDLRTLYGFTTINGKGMYLTQGKGFAVNAAITLDDNAYLNFLKDGVTYFIDNGHQLTIETRYPVQVVGEDKPNSPILPGDPAFFVIQDSAGPVAAVLDGHWMSLR